MQSVAPADQTPAFTPEQWTRMIAFGTPQDTVVGEYLFRSGDPAYDLILVDSGEVEVVGDSLG